MKDKKFFCECGDMGHILQVKIRNYVTDIDPLKANADYNFDIILYKNNKVKCKNFILSKEDALKLSAFLTVDYAKIKENVGSITLIDNKKNELKL